MMQDNTSSELFELSPDLICVFDAEQKIISVNKNSSNFGYSSEELLGKALKEFIYEDSYADFVSSGSGEILFLAKSIDHNSASVRFVPAAFYKSQQYVIIKDLRDIKAKEEALARSKDQLFESEKLASIGQLAAGIAHEINNPLGFVSSNMATLVNYIPHFSSLLEMVRELLDSSAGSDHGSVTAAAEKIRSLAEAADFDFILSDLNDLISESLEGLERIKKIVMDLKQYARRESDEKLASDVNAIMDSASNIVWNQIKYNCELVKEYGKVPKVECNAQQITQVLVNLMTNASHAIDARGTITLRSYSQDQNVIIEVQDTGAGIPESIRNNVFDPLFTTKDPGKGTGLGLSITNEIIKKHSGQITLESEVGKGTLFRVSLPVKAAKQEDVV